MLFLGAGASKPFGIPTMQDFSSEIERALKKKGYGDLIKDIKEQLLRFGFVPDFENIYTTLSSITTPGKAISEAGPFVPYLLKFTEKPIPIPYGEDLKDVLDEIRNLIYLKCSKLDMSKVLSLYDGLFSALRGINYRIGPRSSGSYSLQEIFTTNYDLSVERYCEERDLRLVTGFKTDARGTRLIFDPNLYEATPRPYRIVKLHGSIDQFVREDGTIVKLPYRPTVNSLYGEKYLGEMMIYPIGEKYISRSPYFELFKCLKESIRDLCVVIGYSFRDEAINNAFIDGVRKDEKLKIILIDPNASETIKNVGIIKKNIRMIAMEFEDPKTIEELKSAINQWYPGIEWYPSIES